MLSKRWLTRGTWPRAYARCSRAFAVGEAPKQGDHTIQKHFDLRKIWLGQVLPGFGDRQASPYFSRTAGRDPIQMQSITADALRAFGDTQDDRLTCSPNLIRQRTVTTTDPTNRLSQCVQELE